MFRCVTLLLTDFHFTSPQDTAPRINFPDKSFGSVNESLTFLDSLDIIRTPSTTQSIDPVALLIAMQLLVHLLGNVGGIILKIFSVDHVEKSIASVLLPTDVLRREAYRIPNFLSRKMVTFAVINWRIITCITDFVDLFLHFCYLKPVFSPFWCLFCNFFCK